METEWGNLTLLIEEGWRNRRDELKELISISYRKSGPAGLRGLFTYLNLSQDDLLEIADDQEPEIALCIVAIAPDVGRKHCPELTMKTLVA